MFLTVGGELQISVGVEADLVVGHGAGQDGTIFAGAAVEKIVALASRQVIVASVAAQEIIARASVQYVVAFAAEQGDIPVTVPADVVAAGVTNDSGIDITNGLASGIEALGVEI